MLKSLMVALLALCSSAALAENAATLTVGGKPIRIAIDSRYVSASEKAPALFATAGAALPTGNRLVEMFVAESDIKRMLLGQAMSDAYVQVQTLRDAEDVRLTDADWTRMRPELIRQSGALNVDALAKSEQGAMGKRMSAKSGGAVALEFGHIGKPILHGTDPRSIRFTIVLPMTGTVNGVKRTAQIECVGAITVLHEKLVYIYAYKTLHDGDQNLQPLQLFLDGIVDRTEALN